MKKILLAILGVFFFTSLCFAEGYYASVSHEIKDSTGKTFVAYAITKTPDQEACKKVLMQKGELKGKELINVESFTGVTADNVFKDIFADQPLQMLYISFVDLNGYQTRTYIKTMFSSKKSAPVYKDVPLQSAMIWVNATLQELRALGIKDSKVIYPIR
jgi:hypothetical protein